MRRELVEAYKWYEEDNGKAFFQEHTNMSDFVSKHSKNKGTKEVSGVYMINYQIKSNGVLFPVAIGESDQMGVRFIEHMKNLDEKGELFWGISPSSMKEKGIEIIIDILEDNLLEEADRRKKEAEMIIKHTPILQAKYAKYYPSDKAENKNGRWLIREDVRIDQYIKRALRKERVNEELKAKQKI